MSLVLLLYFYAFHTFPEGSNGKLPVYAALIASTVGSLVWIAGPIRWQFTFEVPIDIPVIPESFLPDWWLLVILIPLAFIMAVDSLFNREMPDYESPRSWEDLPTSPVYFGAVSAFLGFWGVLFVGLGIITRIVVVAPVFEEALKFGVALLIGSAVFGRSLPSRYALALTVGIVFGLVEHTITYPGDADFELLLRVSFHAVTTGLSIAVFTAFERADRLGLMWVALTLPIVLHFANNAAAVLLSLLLAGQVTWVREGAALSYGVGVVLICVALTILAVRRHSLIVRIHEVVHSFGQL